MRVEATLFPSLFLSINLMVTEQSRGRRHITILEIRCICLGICEPAKQ